MLDIKTQVYLYPELFLTRQKETLWTQPLNLFACLCVHIMFACSPLFLLLILSGGSGIGPSVLNHLLRTYLVRTWHTLSHLILTTFLKSGHSHFHLVDMEA